MKNTHSPRVFNPCPGVRYLALPVLFPVSAALAALTWPACSQSSGAPATAPAGSTKKGAPSPAGVRIEAAVFESAAGADRLIRPGEVLGAREARLAVAMGGFVEAVLVRSGATVARNQVIARIDAATRGAEVSLAKIEVDEARRELDRLETMAEAVATARVDAARSRLLRAEAQHRLAVTQAGRSIVRAPFAGVVSNLSLEPGEVVAPGQPLATLVVLDPVHISVSVPGREVATLKPGGRAVAMTVGNAGRLPGRIVRVEPTADRSTRTFAVTVEVPNPKKSLLPDMIAQVEFARDGLDGAVLLPQDVLVTRLEENGVFVVASSADGETTARWRPVKLGRIVGDQVEITEGVSRGDRLVTLGQRALFDGDPVIITREGTCCQDGRVVFLRQQVTAPAPDASDTNVRAPK